MWRQGDYLHLAPDALHRHSECCEGVCDPYSGQLEAPITQIYRHTARIQQTREQQSGRVIGAEGHPLLNYSATLNIGNKYRQVCEITIRHKPSSTIVTSYTLQWHYITARTRSYHS